MRRFLLIGLITLPFAGCGTTQDNQFVAANSLMSQEINDRIDQIPYQHREELFNNLLWLAQSGEQTIPALLKGLRHENPKVRSNCAWVLGKIGDRRVIPQLQALTNDQNDTVRLEVARSLLLMGDMAQAPVLIEGLDSDKVQVRYLCHEALKIASGRDFGFDHLSENLLGRQRAALRWRTWWSEQSGDPFFAQSYATAHKLDPNEKDTGNEWGTPAVPLAEPKKDQGTATTDPSTSGGMQTDGQGSSTQPNGTQPNGTQPNGTQPNGTQSSGTQSSGTQSSGTQSRGR